MATGFAFVVDLCGRLSTAVTTLLRDANSAVPGRDLAAIDTLPPAMNIPDPKGKSCTAEVALPSTPVWTPPPLSHSHSTFS